MRLQKYEVDSYLVLQCYAESNVLSAQPDNWSSVGVFVHREKRERDTKTNTSVNRALVADKKGACRVHGFVRQE